MSGHGSFPHITNPLANAIDVLVCQIRPAWETQAALEDALGNSASPAWAVLEDGLKMKGFPDGSGLNPGKIQRYANLLPGGPGQLRIHCNAR